MAQINAHFLEGSGNVLVITFSEMWNRYGNYRFWGEEALSKLRIPAFGIASDGPHWYPLHETIRALREPVRAARSYKNVVLYGYSMGAYAALKFSWLFEDPVVLAFSPQWSIAPDDVASFDPRYVPFHNPAERVIRLEPEDANGRGYIFFDPTYPVDAGHVERIKAPQRLIRMPRCGHETIHSIRSTAALKELIVSAVTDDHEKVLKIIKSGRNRNPFYARYSINHLLGRGKALLAAKLAHRLTASYEKDPETLMVGAAAFRQANWRREAIWAYYRAFDLTGDERYITWASDLLPENPAGRAT